MTETYTLKVPEEVLDKDIEVSRIIQRKIREYVKGCQNSIRLAVELNRRNVTPEIMDIPGFAAAKNRIMMNHLLSYPKARYLEVGASAGAIFCAALAGNKPEYAGVIGAFSPEAEKMFKENTKTFVGTKFDFNNRDCFNLTAAQKKKLDKINMYFYSGPHSENDHRRAITEYYDYLDDIFIIIVDQWRFQQIRSGTFKGLAEKKIKVWWQIDLKPETIEGADTQNWYNGAWVAVCQKRNLS